MTRDDHYAIRQARREATRAEQRASITTDRLFAYGTLNDPHMQRMLFGRELSGGGKALLKDFEMASYINGIRYIRPREGALVSGRVWNVNVDDVLRADKYEGPSYERKTVTIAGQPTLVYVQAPWVGEL